MSIQIVEIIGRATQGVTRPFICRGEDDEIYFVKGRGAGKRSLICEWIAGNLAKNLELPLAPFDIVDVPDALIQLESRSDLGELGAGPAFGSRKMLVVELSMSHLPLVAPQLQMDVVAFDWWVRNADRTLSSAGGNPNLFWDIGDEKLVVIDHNQAFDLNFSVPSFVESHVFNDQLDKLCGDWDLQQKYCSRFLKAMEGWDEICGTVPFEWWYIDPECTVLLDFDQAALQQSLLGCQADSFWKMQ